MSSSVLAASLPPISKEAYELLAKTFPKPDVEPGVDMNELMYAAGQHHVVEWIRRKLFFEQVITGKVDVSKSVNVKETG